jgi:Arc/MetJ-type ribon-helix-helix transcriptional regulator
MPIRGYKYIVIPAVLHEKVKEHVDASGGRYVYVSEVVRAAIWEFLNAPIKNTEHNVS